MFNSQYIYKKKNVWNVIPLFKSRFFSQAEESLSHRTIVSSLHGIWRRIVACNKSGCRLSWCTLFVGTDTYVLATTTRKTSKAIFSTARATGTWCIPAFYWSMIMPRAYCVPRSDTSKWDFSGENPPHHKQPRHTVPNAHGEMRWDARINAPTRHAQRTTTSTSSPTCMGR